MPSPPLFLSACRCESLVRQGRQVILCGDLNAHSEKIDHCEPHPEFHLGFSHKWMKSLLSYPIPPEFASTSITVKYKGERMDDQLDSRTDISGGVDAPLFCDTFRRLHPNATEVFSCWNTKTGARATNYGTRIGKEVKMSAKSSFFQLLLQLLGYCWWESM